MSEVRVLSAGPLILQPLYRQLSVVGSRWSVGEIPQIGSATSRTRANLTPRRDKAVSLTGQRLVSASYARLNTDEPIGHVSGTGSTKLEARGSVRA